jgi:translation initiation factor 2B subunit (eIF-2B alpha/beta/delta family)
LRPLSPAVAAAVRHIKATVARVSPTLSDDEAREAICADLHAYLSERINVAPLLLAASCRSSSSGDDAAAAGSVAPLSAVAAAPPPLHFSLGPGDSVVTYGHASGVEALLKGLHAQLQHTAGAAAAPGSEATSVDSSCAAGSSGAGASTFTVIIVDARPLLSGQTLLAALCAAGIPCVYSHLPALPRLLARRGVRGVLLGAEAVGVDGSVLAASGSALVAAAAAGAGLPVHIVAESWKFGERPLLDAGAGGANAALSSVGVFNPSRTRAPEVLAPPVVSSALSAAVAKAAKAAEAAAKAVGAGAGAGAGAAAAPRAAAAAPKAAGAPKAAAAGAGGKGGSGGKEAEIQPCASSGRIEHDTVVPGPVVFAAHAASSSAAVSSAPAAAASSSSGGGKSGPGGAAASVGFSPLTNWRRKPGIKLLALAADVTPARHVTALLTEAGPLPPAAVHVLLQAFGRLEEHDAEEGEGEDGEGEDEDGEGDYHEGGGEAEDGEVEDGGAPDGEEDVVFAV